jgi:hypothetical protein
LLGGVDERLSQKIGLPGRAKNGEPPEYYCYSNLLVVSIFKSSRPTIYHVKLMTMCVSVLYT